MLRCVVPLLILGVLGCEEGKGTDPIDTDIPTDPVPTAGATSTSSVTTGTTTGVPSGTGATTGTGTSPTTTGTTSPTSGTTPTTPTTATTSGATTGSVTVTTPTTTTTTVTTPTTPTVTTPTTPTVTTPTTPTVTTPTTPTAIGTPPCGPVMLDMAFDANGLANYAAPGTDYDDNAYVTLVQDDGRILMGGRYYTNANGRTVSLARLNVDGTLDLSFGGGDGFVDALFTTASSIYGLALQSDGKILASGEYGGDLFVARFDDTGALDPSFGTGGYAVHPTVQVHYNTRSHMAVQLDGSMVVAGHESGAFKVVRYLSDGTLDAGFGVAGVASADLTGTTDEAYTLMLQPDGHIVVAGRADLDFGVARFDATGLLDPGFGTGGMVTVDINQTDEAYGLAWDDGAMMVVGCSACSFSYLDDTGWGIARLLSDGTLDPGFNGTGLLYDPIPASLVAGTGLNDKAWTAFVYPSGEILVGGQNQWNDGAGRMVLARYLSNGSLDLCFDQDGYYVQHTWDVFGQSDAAYDLDVLADGSVLVSGTVNPSAWGYKAVFKMLP